METYTVIGEGLSGIVYYPALPCKDKTSNFNSTGFVSKLTTRKNAEQELANASEINRTIPTHAIFATHICESHFQIVTKSKKVLDTLVFSKYGGIEITLYQTEMEKYAYSSKLSSEDKRNATNKLPLYRNILNALQELREQVEQMNNKHFFHNDISYDNIVYSIDTNQAYLIDFERSGPIHRTSTSRHMPPMPTDVEQIDGMIVEFKFEINEIEKKLADANTHSMLGGKFNNKTRLKSHIKHRQITTKYKTTKYKTKKYKTKKYKTKKYKTKKYKTKKYNPTKYKTKKYNPTKYKTKK
jgi:serine/threonine protein kinase